MTDAVVPAGTIPPQLLYWCCLPREAAALGPVGQDYRFERVLPVPVESLHIVRAPIPGGGVVMAGIEPDRLRSHLAQAGLTPDIWNLLPERIPEHLHGHLGSDGEVVRRGLNLLHGPFEPQPRRRQRLVTIGILQGLGVLVTLLLVIGTERRVAHTDAAVALMRQQQADVIATVLQPDPANPLPLPVRLLAEVRRLEQVSAGARAATVDTVAIMRGLWLKWPRDLRAQVDSLIIDQGRATFRGRVPTLADAERLAAALAEVDAGRQRLRAEPLQAQQTDQGASFVLTLAPVAGAAP